MGLEVSAFPAVDLLFNSELLEADSVSNSGDGLKATEGSEILKRVDGVMVYAAGAAVDGLRERKKADLETVQLGER